MAAKQQRLLLLGGFLLFAAVELLPIIVFARVQGIWALNNFEDFDFLFWPPLNVAFTPSHFFFHVGAVSWGLMKPIHAATAMLTGSPTASLAYLQTFGYLTRGLYSALMLAVPLVCWWRRREPLLVLLVLAMGLSLHLATPYIFQMYHLRVGTQLTNKLLVLVTAALSFDALLAFLAGRRLGSRQVFLSAIFAGIVFAEIPSYILFFLPFVVFSHGGARGVGDVLLRCLVWIAGGLAGFLLGYALFYGLDWQSGLSALCSMVKGLLAGFPQPQPGFRERFIVNLFNPKDDYFWIHVSLAAHIGLLLVLLLSLALHWRAVAPRVRFAVLTVALAFPTVWLAHSRIWATRGSYTSVFSLVYYGFFSSLLGFLLLVVITRAIPPGSWRRPTSAIAAGLTLAVLVTQWGITLGKYNFNSLLISQRAIGLSFRSLSTVIDGLPKPINLKLIGLPDLPFMLPGHYALAGFFLHAGEDGWNAEDARYSQRIQQQRFPGYRMLWSLRANHISYDYVKRHLQLQADEGWLPLPEGTVIVRLPRPVPVDRLTTLEQHVHLSDPAQLSPDQSIADFLHADPLRGLVWLPPATFPYARWVLLPLNDPALTEEVVDSVWPATWDRNHHRFYLVRTQTGQCLVALPLPPAKVAPAGPNRAS